MTISQNGHALNGESTIVQGKDLDNPSQVTNFFMVGNIWEDFITLNQQGKGRTRLCYLTSLLQVLNGGIRLKCAHCFRSIHTDKTESLEIKWERKEQKQS